MAANGSRALKKQVLLPTGCSQTPEWLQLKSEVILPDPDMESSVKWEPLLPNSNLYTAK
jgi:hypothetical protein